MNLMCEKVTYRCQTLYCYNEVMFFVCLPFLVSSRFQYRPIDVLNQTGATRSNVILAFDASHCCPKKRLVDIYN